MKEFWYKNLREYIDVSDQYHDPKTIKMFSIEQIEGKKLFVAITYLRTSIIGHKQAIRDDAHEGELRGKVEGHGHKEGEMREVAPLRV